MFALYNEESLKSLVDVFCCTVTVCDISGRKVVPGPTCVFFDKFEVHAFNK